MELTGARIMVKSLEDEGVRTVFGLPGGSVIPLYDALYDSDIRQILVRHEQAAAHAADGFFRAGGGVGVCIATSGPGATNLITGIAAAQHDSSAMVAITGQVPTHAIGTDFFQEAHIMGISIPIVKHSMQARRAADIPMIMHDALRIARTGRPGPVLVDLPSDVQNELAEYARPNGTMFPAYREEPEESLERMGDAVDFIKRSKRPLIIAGNGINISGAFDELHRFSSDLGIPVVNSLLGKGAVPDGSEFAVGMIGMHGRAAANRAVLQADLIIAIGTRFSDRSTGKRQHFAADVPVIHIDIDISEIHKNIGASVWLIGDAKKVLRMLRSELSGCSASARCEWLANIRGLDEAEPLRRETTPGAIRAWQVFDALDDVTKGNIVVTTEVGQHQIMAALYHKSVRPRSFLTSGGQGTMGFGIPAAMGAHFARPDVPIFCIAGDGSSMMNIQELDTYARYGLPIKVLLMDNGCLGMVRQWQQMFFRERYSNTIYTRSPDFVKIAQGMGVEAFGVSESGELRSAIERALRTDGPALVHIPILQSENVFPMVPAGSALDEMIV